MAVTGRARRAVLIGLITAAAGGLSAWAGFRAASRAEEAVDERASARLLDTLLVARALDAAPEPARDEDVRAALAAAGVEGAAAVYGPSGGREAVASAGAAGDLARSLPESPPRGGAGPRPESAAPAGGPADGVALTSVALGAGRRLVLAQPGARAGSWLRTLVAYQLLTLAVVLAGVAVALWRLGRAARPQREAAGARAARDTHADGTRREADFVVETFHSVIGELQLKGRELEQATRRERERADRSERFSERVIAHMPTGLVVVDRSGRVTAANASAREIFPGLPGQRSESTAYRDAFAEAPGLSDMVGRCIREGASSHRREVEMLSPEGARRWLGVSVSAIASPDGRPDAALCLVTELTEVIALRDRLRVQENLASLGEMAAGLAHELKNSLATIQGYGQLLARIVPEDAAGPSAALVEEVRQMTQMVTDFLNFARPQSPALAPTPLARVVDAALARAEEALEREGVELSVELPEGLEVLADEALLGRALLNLFQNSAEALAGSEPPRRLDVTASAAGAECVLEVRDNGPGIPPADLERIFIPFFTTKSRGHGIGLALAHKILTAHQGFVTAENASPGARFRCVLRVPAGADRAAG